MKLLFKFLICLAIGYGISRTEKPIHRLERGIAGPEGVSDWYLIMRYIIGTGALGIALVIMLYNDDNLESLITEDAPAAEKFERLLNYIGAAYLSGAVGVGSGVGLGFLKNSLEDA